MPAIHGPAEEHGKNIRLRVCPLNCTRRASMIFFMHKIKVKIMIDSLIAVLHC